MKQKITMIECKHNIYSQIDYFLDPLVTIKGLKKLDDNISIYLIELINYNRVWAIHVELDI